MSKRSKDGLLKDNSTDERSAWQIYYNQFRPYQPTLESSTSDEDKSSTNVSHLLSNKPSTSGDKKEVKGTAPWYGGGFMYDNTYNENEFPKTVSLSGSQFQPLSTNRDKKEVKGTAPWYGGGFMYDNTYSHKKEVEGRAPWYGGGHRYENTYSSVRQSDQMSEEKDFSDSTSQNSRSLI